MISTLPAINAALNFLAFCLLALGWWMIRRKNIPAHKTCMIAAFCVSAAFLTCYLFYHYHAGSRPFPGTGAARLVYFSILIPHILLAIVMLPMIYLTFVRAFRGEFDKHKRIAKWTLGIWLYVSITGVLVYWMLYQMTW